MKFQIFTNIELEVKGTPRNVYTIMLPCMDNFFSASFVPILEPLRHVTRIHDFI